MPHVAYFVVGVVFVLVIAGLVLVARKSASSGAGSCGSLEDMKKRAAVLEAVTFAAEKFLETSEWESRAKMVLEKLGIAVQTDRVCIFVNTDDAPSGALLIQQFEWTALGVGSTVSGDAVDGNFDALEFELPRWAEVLGAGQTITSCTDKLPTDEQIFLDSRGAKSVLAVPIFVGADWWGCVVYENRQLRAWEQSEIDSLETASRIIGSAIHKEHVTQELQWAYHQEINIGLEIQNRLLVGAIPENICGAQIAAISIPSQRIDGDFYDFIRYNRNHFDLIVGDVLGKGVSGALLGAATKNQLLQAAGNLVCSTNLSALPTPEEIVTAASEQLCDKFITLNSFATACCARFNLDKQRMDFVDCGYTKLLHYRRKTNDCVMLKGVNFPLGFSRDEIFEQTSVHLENGDVVMFYSNGVVEPQNSDGLAFGPQRLEKLLVANSDIEPDDFIKLLYRELVSFTGSQVFPDDLTYIVVKINIPAPETPLLSKSLTLTSQMSNLRRLRELLAVIFEQTEKVTAEFASQMEIAVIESATNIIRHAYGGAEDQQLEIAVNVYEDRITVFLSHWGEAFKKFQMSTPSFDGSQSNGYGLYLMRQCVDEVLYDTDEETNRHTVELLKMLPETK